jgi:hypothetical protein
LIHNQRLNYLRKISFLEEEEEDEIDLSIISIIGKTCMVSMWWSKIEIREYRVALR